MPLGRAAGRRAGRRSARRVVRRQDMFSGDSDEPMSQDVPAEESSATDQLEEIAALKTKGLITQEEYDAKKKQILGI